MARTPSQDLRDGVVAAIDGGLSCRAAAARFGVGLIWSEPEVSTIYE
jgi:transposase